MCEALLIKKQPILNAQEHSVALEVFNWNRLHLCFAVVVVFVFVSFFISFLHDFVI